MDNKHTLYVWYCNGDVWGCAIEGNKVIRSPHPYRTALDLYSALTNPDKKEVIYDQPPKEYLIKGSE